MPPPPNKKRKKSVTIAPSNPTQVALPPPLIPYPPPHLMPSYYPVYHQHPYFLSVGPQPPISPSLSPTLSSSASSTTAPVAASATPAAPAAQRILPKSPASTPSTTAATAAISPPTLAPTFNFYPYPMQISPQLHPTAPVSAPPLSPVPFGIRHNSVSSTTSNSTADQREQARKVSHSAIERRRRERINDKILQLKDLIPSCSDRENLHKMTILQSAIDYITYLKKVIDDSPTKQQQEGHPPSLPDQLQKSSSMLPKEVDQFTTQFSAHPPKSQTAASGANGTSKSIEAEEDVEASLVEEEEDEEDSWSMSTSKIDRSKAVTMSTVTPLPSSGLKPMDVIKLNKSASASLSCSPPSPTVTPPPAGAAAPPKIIVNSQEVLHEEEENSTASYSHTERNMNLENILC
ncbi:helix-loop-helix DNA-binding domain-containing transcription factor [Mucor lusitanicus CBS 277.49]|uniref:Helix-loop-helix DNA-binding domain-containing transcription factor n=2 Tax=Mucor circinelloides f. lusitanicus TaxID=29924 RepID=A0A168NVU2_MUCCL|nr:helix-loop-helix DNA-binding domain-containing transcription factor [Mucor lusitanicus CBS 277.49]